MITLPLSFTLSTLPSNLSMDANTYGQTIIANLTGTLSANLLTGQTRGNQPSQDIGPWFDGSQWWAYRSNQGVYQPLVPQRRYSTIINGQTQVWQRQTSFTGVANATKTADRYSVAKNLATGVANVTQTAINLTATPNYPNTEFAVRITVTTPQSTIAAGEYFEVQQYVERQNAFSLFGLNTSFSIVMRSSVAGTYCASLSNFDNSESYVMECVLPGANIAYYFPFENIPAFPTGTGNWGTNDTDFAYSVRVCATAGTNLQAASALNWVNSNGLADANQTNLFATNGATLDFTLIQHENGPTSSPFIWVPFGDDLRRCQRYYFKTYDYLKYAGDTSNVGIVVPTPSTTTNIGVNMAYPVPLRIAPTVNTNCLIYSANTGTVNKVYDTVGATDRAVSSGNSTSVMVQNLALAALSSTSLAEFHVIADVDS